MIHRPYIILCYVGTLTIYVDRMLAADPTCFAAVFVSSALFRTSVSGATVVVVIVLSVVPVVVLVGEPPSLWS